MMNPSTAAALAFLDEHREAWSTIPADPQRGFSARLLDALAKLEGVK